MATATHRGRIQAQGGGLNKSVAWAQKFPPTLDEGQRFLMELIRQLTRPEKDARASAIVAASRWISRAGSAGGAFAQTRRSFKENDARAGERIDIEVISGAAFTPVATVPRAQDAGAQPNLDAYSMSTQRKYELWQCADGTQFFPSDNESARKLLDPDAHLIKAFEASSWEEAQAMMHEFLGWEPYVPMK